MSLTYDGFYYPFGRGQATFDFSKKIKELKDKYFSSINKGILVSLVYDKKHDIYDFFFKVPSEDNGKLLTDIYYDTIIEFIPDPKNKQGCLNASGLKDYHINIYSNSPGFTFTSTYVIKHRYNAIPKCVTYNLLSKVALQQAPVIKNQYQLMTMEKTTWWSLYHLDYNGFLNKEKALTLINKDKNINFFLKKIESQPEKLKELQEIKKLTKQEREKLNKKQINNHKDYNKPLTVTEKREIANNLKHSMKFSFKVKPTKNILKKNMNFDGFKFNSSKK